MNINYYEACEIIDNLNYDGIYTEGFLNNIKNKVKNIKDNRNVKKEDENKQKSLLIAKNKQAWNTFKNYSPEIHFKIAALPMPKSYWKETDIPEEYWKIGNPMMNNSLHTLDTITA